jgi:hypothetical protein
MVAFPAEKQRWWARHVRRRPGSLSLLHPGLLLLLLFLLLLLLLLLL